MQIALHTEQVPIAIQDRRHHRDRRHEVTPQGQAILGLILLIVPLDHLTVRIAQAVLQVLPEAIHQAGAIRRVDLHLRREVILRVDRQVLRGAIHLAHHLHDLTLLPLRDQVVREVVRHLHQVAAGLLRQEETKKNKTYEIVRGGSRQQLAHPFYIP